MDGETDVFLHFLTKWEELSREDRNSRIRESFRDQKTTDDNHGRKHWEKKHFCKENENVQDIIMKRASKSKLDNEKPHVYSAYSRGKEPTIEKIAESLCDKLDDLDKWLADDSSEEKYNLHAECEESLGQYVVAENPEILNGRTEDFTIMLKKNRGEYQTELELPFYVAYTFPSVSNDTYEKFKIQLKTTD